MPRTKRTRAEKEIKATLARVAPEEVAGILETAIEESIPRAQERLDKSALPGQTVNGLKKPWTFEAIKKIFPIVSFIPEETICLTWNGVRQQCYSGVEMHTPKCFYDIYLRYRSETRKAAGALPRDMGFEVTIGIGAGALN